MQLEYIILEQIKQGKSKITRLSAEDFQVSEEEFDDTVDLLVDKKFIINAIGYDDHFHIGIQTEITQIGKNYLNSLAEH